ncbi:MAG: hypothetical protein COA45_01220 [Zetaproteobacteria bacterium]|nr:MAG: hypothetical protein COA45_01220 [Zetaproteobacteria bacterium]
MKKYLMALFVMGAVWGGCLVGGSSVAHADILITPTRVVFGERDRFGVVTLANNGDKVSTYKISWRFFKMQEEGPAYKPLNQADMDYDVSKYIVFSPRQVTLQPGAVQKIRLALRRPADMPEGDYHVHLGISTVPNDDPDVVPTGNAKNGRPISRLGVEVNVGYTIPIIVRSGKVDVNSSIGRISLSRNQKNGFLKVAVPVHREGAPYSILGHLMVYHIDENGDETRVGEISNAHIFPEVDRRVFDVHLIKDIVGGSLRIVMYDYTYSNVSGNNYIYTERTFPLE